LREQRPGCSLCGDTKKIELKSGEETMLRRVLHHIVIKRRTAKAITVSDEPIVVPCPCTQQAST
jgi:hypothetical protein